MKKIKYEVHEGICDTPCPYWSKIEGIDGYCVGSGACYCYPYCVSQDSDNHILECKADEVQLNKDMENESMKAEEYIESESFVVVNPDYPVISKEKALEAVEMARLEERRNALNTINCAVREDKDVWEVLDAIITELKKEI